MIFFFFPSANLTGHAEKVGIENFELLKVLGTGGKMHYFSKLNVGALLFSIVLFSSLGFGNRNIL